MPVLVGQRFQEYRFKIYNGIMITLLADGLAILGASASAGFVLTPETTLFNLQHQKSQLFAVLNLLVLLSSTWYFQTVSPWTRPLQPTVAKFVYSISQEICTRFLLCCALLWLYIDWFPISIRLTSLALWQSNDCHSASKATLMKIWINI